MPLNRKIKFGIEIGLLLGTAIIMALAVSVGFTTYLGNPKHPHVAVTTGSMIPIYNGFFESYDSPLYPIFPFQGDILLVRNVPIESIDVGDVIIFDTSAVSDPVVHRVVAKWEENGTHFFKTKGDNNDAPDNWGMTTGENVLGVVIIRIPHVGWFLLAIQTTMGRLIVLVIAILVLFISDGSEENNKVSNAKNSNIKSFNHLKTSGTRIKRLKNNMINNKNYFYSFCALLIIIFFVGINLAYSVTSSPSIELYPLNDSLKTQNLLLSTNSSIFHLTSPSDIYHWRQTDNETEAYFFPIQIVIRSGGLFNNIDKIEILTTVDGKEGFYSWNIVYNFIGTRSFKGGIIATLNPVNTTHFANISLILYSRGFFAPPPQILEFVLILDSR
ncbi:MAG: signal peptidase I [Candidatus Hodarchaeota archaeon]